MAKRISDLLADFPVDEILDGDAFEIARPSEESSESSSELLWSSHGITIQQLVDYVAASVGVPADVMSFEGAIDCSANPNYPAADAGHVYKVSVAGKIGGGAGPNVEAGDAITCTVDASAAGTHAAVGANWFITQANVDGAVIGPSAAVDGEPALFDGATGRLIKRATGSGYPKLTAGVQSVQTAAQLAADLQGDGLTADLAGFRGIPQTSFSANTTIAAAHNGRQLYHPASDPNARTLTIDANGTLALPIGFTFTVINETSQAVSIAITTDTLVLVGTGATGTRTLAQYGMATAVKVTATRWYISGTGLT